MTGTRNELPFVHVMPRVHDDIRDCLDFIDRQPRGDSRARLRDIDAAIEAIVRWPALRVPRDPQARPRSRAASASGSAVFDHLCLLPSRLAISDRLRESSRDSSPAGEECVPQGEGAPARGVFVKCRWGMRDAIRPPVSGLAGHALGDLYQGG